MTARFTLTFGALTMARQPVLAGLFIVAIVAISIAFVPSLQFESDVGRGYATDSDESRALDALTSELEVRARQLVVMAETEGTAFTVDELLRLRDLSLDIALLDGVAQVTSPFALRFPAPQNGQLGRPMLDLTTDPLASLEAFSRAYPGIPTLISADRRALTLFAAPQNDLDEAQLRTLLGEVRGLSQAVATPSMRLLVAGEDSLMFAVIDVLKIDLGKLIAIGPACALLLSTLIMRSFRWALIAFLPAVAATLVALAAFPLMGVPITATSVVVPVLVLMLALSDAIHLTWHLRDQLVDHRLAEALERSIRAIGPANALTSMTTGIGFLAIAASEFEPLDEMAMVGTFSVVVAYWVVLSGIVVLAPLGRPAKRIATEHFKIPAVIASWPVQRPKTVLLITALAFALSGQLASRIEPWFSVHQYLPDRTDIRESHRLIEDRFGGYFRMWLELDRPQHDVPESGASAVQWDRLEAITEALRSVRPEATILSALTYARWAGVEQGMREGVDDQALDELPSALRAELGLNNPAVDRLLILMPEPMYNTVSRDVHDAVVAAALAAGADRAIGFPTILREDALQVVYDLGAGLVVACILATGLVAITFGSVWLFPILLVPNIIPLLVATASLALLNSSQINPAAVLALTVAFGAAVDDSIHLLNRYALRREQGKSTEEAIYLAIRGAGRVMVTTTLVVSAGIASTFVSDFELIRLFGSLFIVIFASALVADLLVLPALIHLGYKR